MTTKTDTAKAEAAKGAAGNYVAHLAGELGLLALFAWTSTLVLGGFGISVPFLPVWAGVIVALVGVKLLTEEVAKPWHAARVKADINLIAASMAAQEMTRSHQETGLANFLSKLGEPTDTGNGGYL